MITPKLALNFTSGTLNPIIGFSRTGATATRTNSSGLIESVAADIARFDYDPITLACKGLLIEESRSNAFIYSEQLDNAVWSRTNASVGVNAIASPDGNVTADKLIENTSTGVHRVFNSPSVAINNTASYAVTFYVKAGGRNHIDVYVNNGVQTYVVYFDLVNIASKLPGGFSTPTQHRIVDVGDNWRRCIVVIPPFGSATALQLQIRTATDYFGTESYTGDGTSGVYLWGFQMETGAFPTSYIPTTTTALTRNADVATITGTNFSSFWQATRGGVLVRALPSTVSGIRPLVQFDDNTANEIIALRGNTTNPELYIVDGGAPQAQIDAGTITANTAYSLTGWWATNDCKARKDSGAVVTDTTATIPTVTQARLGSDGTNYLNGHLASISYYDSFSEQIYTRRKNKAVFNLM